MNPSKTLDKMFKQYEKIFTKPIKINNVDSSGFFYEIQSNQTNWKPDTKNLFVKRDSVKQGDLISALNEYWLVIDDVITYNSVYDKAIVQRCNNITKINFMGNIVPFQSIVISRTLGISDRPEANFLDGDMNITIQDTEVARRIVIDQRIVFKNQAFYVSGLDSSAIGLITLNCRLTETSNLYDDYKNSIPDRYRYENTYEIDVVNGNCFNIGLNQETQLVIRVWATNKMTQQRFEITNPVLTYVSYDENILSVSETGNITTLAEGITFIHVILKSNNTENAEVVADERIEVNVHDAVVIENSVTITGNATISFDFKAKYTAKLFANGIEVADTFTFTIVNNATSVAVATSIAKLLNITSTTCEVQAGETRLEIRLIATSVSTGIEANKIITLKDIL